MSRAPSTSPLSGSAWEPPSERVTSRVREGPTSRGGPAMTQTAGNEAPVLLRRKSTAKRGFQALFDALPVQTYAWRVRGDDLTLLAHNRAAAIATQGRAARWMGV